MPMPWILPTVCGTARDAEHPAASRWATRGCLRSAGLALTLSGCPAAAPPVAPNVPEGAELRAPSQGGAAESKGVLDALPSGRQTPAAPANSPTPGAPRIVIDSGGEAGPWTHLAPPHREGAPLRFAIVSDHAAAPRRGVFESAIPKLNSLAPDLVLSVGDLIKGKGTTRKALRKEWDGIDGLVRRLDAPFFYVAGNHDVDGEARRRVWRDRFGRTYYAFAYSGVLFVCLDTVDSAVGEIGDEQLAWLRGVLDRHANVKWTFVVMHSPLWDVGNGRRRPKNQPSVWDKVAAILGERPYTVFAGHRHRYVKHERGGRSLYTLATTGGGSGLRGPEYGEFDHVAWVTLTDRGPVVTNLALDGILGDAPRTEESRAFEASVLGRGALEPTPIYFDHGFREGTSTVRLRNSGDAPLKVELSTVAREPLGVVPAAVSLTVEPHSTMDQSFKVVSRSPWSADGAGVDLKWRVTSTGASGQPLELNGSTVLSVVRLVSAPKAPRRVNVDGRLDDWHRLGTVVDVPRQVSGNAVAWRGPEDNRFRMGVSYDRDWLYVAVDVTDDSVDAKEKTRPWAQDGVEIRVDARPDPARAHSGGAGDGDTFLRIALSPSESPTSDWLYASEGTQLPSGTEVACVRTSDGYIAEVAIPRSWITTTSGRQDGVVRLNVAVHDRDTDGRSASWWWPDWRSPEDLPGSGTIRLGP